jgi:decaprenylphospho-beta-D-ribofuranose 2-oxidase
MNDRNILELRSLFKSAFYGPQMGYAETRSSKSLVIKPSSLEECKEIINYCSQENIKICCRGGGFSYGDMILNTDELILDISSMSNILSWNPEKGEMSLEPGVSFASIFKISLLDNWSLTSCPGGMDVTIGGAISNNVHGKDAWKNGNFGHQVTSIELLLSNSKILVIEKNDPIFKAVIGGMGMLGVIVKINIQLQKIPSPFVQIRTQLAKDISETVDLLELRKEDSDFSVAWVDAFATGDSIGRGYVSSASWVVGDLKTSKEDLEKSLTKPKYIFGFLPSKPIWFVGRFFFKPVVLKFLNKLHYLLAKKTFAKQGKSSKPVLFTDYNFMHNKIPDIKEVYRPYGFFEFEPLLPKDSGKESLKGLLKLCQKYKSESLLCGIKSHKNDDFLISFEGRGYSIGIDIQVAGRTKNNIDNFVNALSEFTIKNKGKIYLAKDENLSKISFQKMYPQYQNFLKLKKNLDPNSLFISDMFKRLLS